MAKKRLVEESQLEHLDEFYKIIALLNDPKDVKAFLKDLMSSSERVMITRRIQIAKMLFRGLTYDQIKSQLQVGNSTITKVDNSVLNGLGGYKSALKQIRESSDKKLSKKEINNFSDSFEVYRKKRPAQFALLNLLLGMFEK